MMHNGWTRGLVLALVLAAQGVQAQEEQRPLTPAEAAEKASRVNSRGFKGTFTFEVKGVGSNGEDSFILSEPDYRDPRCLTLRVTPQVREQLEARFGGKLDQVLAGRQIVVSGAAVRVRMEQVAQKVTGSLGEPSRGQEQTTGQFYFQTHIKVTQADQIVLI